MKKLSILFFAVLGFGNCAFPQNYSARLTFTAIYQNLHIPLDSVFIQNLTKECDTMLYAPDTVLFLGSTESIAEYAKNLENGFFIYPNYHNPFIGQTDIRINLGQKMNEVRLAVYNHYGQLLSHMTSSLPEGTHRFRFVAGSKNMYYLTVTCNRISQTIKMVSLNCSDSNANKLFYIGQESSSSAIKSVCLTSSFEYAIGDQLRFIGYANTSETIPGSDVVEDMLLFDKDYTFNIMEGLPCPGMPLIVYEEDVYLTVLIDNRCWLKNNLNVGVRINRDDTQSNNNIIEKYCYDDHLENCFMYGGLYSWDEMMNYSSTEGSQGICPAGWHVPTDAEWLNLFTFLGEQNVAGGKMKEIGTLHWETPNYAATNQSGFNALPGGYKEYYYYGNIGYYKNIEQNALFWSSTMSDDEAFSYALGFDMGSVYRSEKDIRFSFSIRCIKDQENLKLNTNSQKF
jgi:uncharacterized protein (TIGR02145 family)